jgi:hypothetical protein
MDPILQQLLQESGKTVLAAALAACMAKLLRSKKKKKQLTPKEEAQVQKAAERMIHLATMEDVRRYSPTYQAVSRVMKRGLARKKAAPKRAAAKKAVKRRPASTKRSAKKANN